ERPTVCRGGPSGPVEAGFNRDACRCRGGGLPFDDGIRHYTYIRNINRVQHERLLRDVSTQDLYRDLLQGGCHRWIFGLEGHTILNGFKFSGLVDPRNGFPELDGDHLSAIDGNFNEPVRAIGEIENTVN